MAFGPITSRNRWGNNGNSDRLYFWGSKTTTAMTNLDCILNTETLLYQQRPV